MGFPLVSLTQNYVLLKSVPLLKSYYNYIVYINFRQDFLVIAKLRGRSENSRVRLYFELCR